MSLMASQITSLRVVYSTIYSDADHKKPALKLCVTGLCVGNSPVTGEFPTQRANNAEDVFIWWRHHVSFAPTIRYMTYMYPYSCVQAEASGVCYLTETK